MDRNIIEEIMVEKNLTMHQVAKLIDYDIAVLSKVKNRNRKMSHKLAFKISQVFGYDLDEIIMVEKI